MKSNLAYLERAGQQLTDMERLLMGIDQELDEVKQFISVYYTSVRNVQAKQQRMLELLGEIALILPPKLFAIKNQWLAPIPSAYGPPNVLWEGRDARGNRLSPSVLYHAAKLQDQLDVQGVNELCHALITYLEGSLEKTLAVKKEQAQELAALNRQFQALIQRVTPI